MFFLAGNGGSLKTLIYKNILESKISGDKKQNKNKNKNAIRKMLGRGTVNTCVKI